MNVPNIAKCIQSNRTSINWFLYSSRCDANQNCNNLIRTFSYRIVSPLAGNGKRAGPANYCCWAYQVRLGSRIFICRSYIFGLSNCLKIDASTQIMWVSIYQGVRLKRSNQLLTNWQHCVYVMCLQFASLWSYLKHLPPTCCDVDWCEVSLRLLQELELVLICRPPKLATVVLPPVRGPPPLAVTLPFSVGVLQLDRGVVDEGPLFLLKLSMSVVAGLNMPLCELSEKSVICEGREKKLLS